MPIFRVQHNCFYTCISNAAIRDRRLTYGARGLHHDLLSNSDEWDITIKALAAINKEGRTAIAKYLNELKEFGYLEQEQSREKGSFAKSVYLVHELPEGTIVDFQDGKQMVAFPTREEVAKALQSKQNAVSRKPDRGTVPVVSSTDHGDTAYGSTDHGESAPIEVTTVSNNNSEEVTKEKRSDFSGNSDRWKPVDQFKLAAEAAKNGKNPCPHTELVRNNLVEGLWVGPKSYHWDPRAIELAQKRKRELKQADTLANAQTYINNLIFDAQRYSNWAKVEQFRDEALGVMANQQEESTVALMAIAPSPSNIGSLITRELQRLDKGIRLLGNWPQQTGKRTSHQLDYQESVGYLAYLRTLKQEVPHAS